MAKKGSAPKVPGKFLLHHKGITQKDLVTFSSRLAAAMGSLTPETLALKLGCSRTLVRRFWLSGSRLPPLLMVGKIAQALEVSPRGLIEGTILERLANDIDAFPVTTSVTLPTFPATMDIKTAAAAKSNGNGASHPGTNGDGTKPKDTGDVIPDFLDSFFKDCRRELDIAHEHSVNQLEELKDRLKTKLKEMSTQSVSLERLRTVSLADIVASLDRPPQQTS